MPSKKAINRTRGYEEKYLLKPLHHHYDNAHEEMTLKFNILAKSEGGGGSAPQQHNIFSGCGSGSGAVY